MCIRDRRIGLWANLQVQDESVQLTLTDEDGYSATVQQPFPAAQRQQAHDAQAAVDQIRTQLGRLGTTIFIATSVDITWARGQLDSSFPVWDKPQLHEMNQRCPQPMVPSSQLNTLHRDAVQALEAARHAAFARLPRARPVEPPVPYPDDTLTYLANVFNQSAHAVSYTHLDVYKRQEVSSMVSRCCDSHNCTAIRIMAKKP